VPWGSTLGARNLTPDRQWMTTMIDEQFARMRTHRNNIHRYRQLLQTNLTELERDFIEKRLTEEQSALDGSAASAFPLTS
jgi:hypothetical protein